MVSFVGRCDNGAAHALCREWLHHNNPMYWVEEAPEEVVHAASRDLASFKNGCSENFISYLQTHSISSPLPIT
ncbi:hypothetical protein V6N13_014008 [Hibiscus sabdariffa]